MVNYQQLIKENKELSRASIVKPIVRTETTPPKNNNEQILKEYINARIAEGYILNPDGSLTKIERSQKGKTKKKKVYTTTTTTITINDKGEVSKNVSVVTTKPSSYEDPLVRKANRLEATLRGIDSGKVEASEKARASVQKQLNQVYEMIKNRDESGATYVTVPEEKQYTVFDSKGLGYSVAPILQESFLATKEASYNKSSSNIKFYAPKQTNASETFSTSIAPPSLPKTQAYGGVIKASTSQDWSLDAQKIAANKIPLIERYENKALYTIQNLNTPLKNVAVVAVGAGYGGVKKALDYKHNPQHLAQDVTLGVAATFIPQAVAPIVLAGAGGLFYYDIISAPNKLEAGERLGSGLYQGAIMTEAGAGYNVLSNANKFSQKDVRLSTAETLPGLTTPRERWALFLNPEITRPYKPVSEPFFIIGGKKITQSVPEPQTTLNSEFIAKEQIEQLRAPVDFADPYSLRRGGSSVRTTTLKTDYGNMDIVIKAPEPQQTELGSKVLDTPLGKIEIKAAEEPKTDNWPGWAPTKPQRVSEMTPKERKAFYERLEAPKQTSNKETQTNFPVDYGRTKKISLEPKTIDLKQKSQSLAGSSSSLSSNGPSLELEYMPVKVEVTQEGAIKTVQETKLTTDTNKLTRTDIKTENKIMPITLALPKNTTITTPLTKNISIVNQLNTTNLITETKTKNIPIYEVGIMTEAATVTRQETLLKSVLEYRTETRTKPLYSTKLNLLPEPGTPPPIIKKPSPGETKKSKGLFKTLVKSRGKFENKGTFSDLKSAVNRGVFVVENTAAASFKIEGNYKPGEVSLNNKFTTAKYNKNIFVQKRSFRISSLGEKAEIPGRARILKKGKKIF